jgi:hypothetical protein
MKKYLVWFLVAVFVFVFAFTYVFDVEVQADNPYKYSIYIRNTLRLQSGATFAPTASDGAAIGTTDLEFSDLYLADGGVIYFQDDQSVTATGASGGVAFSGSPTFATSALPDAADGAAIGSASAEWSDIYLADAGVLYFQNDQSVTITGAAGGVAFSGSPTFATSALPDAADGAALGSATAEWSDLFLADAGVINLGADQDVPITHVADAGVLMQLDDYISFGDAAVYIESDDDGYLDLDADVGVRLNTVNVDVDSVLTIDGFKVIQEDSLYFITGTDTFVIRTKKS